MSCCKCVTLRSPREPSSMPISFIDHRVHSARGSKRRAHPATADVQVKVGRGPKRAQLTCAEESLAGASLWKFRRSVASRFEAGLPYATRVFLPEMKRRACRGDVPASASALLYSASAKARTPPL